MGFVQKEFKNVMTLYYLAKLDKKVPTDYKKAKAKQNRRVHRVMKTAYKIPFYRERFESRGLTPDDFHSAEDLAKFPVMTRNDMRLWMQSIIEKDPDIENRTEVFRTSGSTGIPLKFMISHREAACVNANWIRVTMFAGYKPFTGKMMSFLTTHSKVDPNKGDSWIQKLGLLRRKIVPEHLYQGEKMKDLIELVNDYKPDILCFRKNVLVRMAVYARTHGMEIYKPKIYTPVSEMVDEMTRKLFFETYGPGMMDAYGTNETGSCAVRLPGKDSFYVYSDTHVLNIHDENDQLANEGRIIATTLFKHDFPVINYEVGDMATSEMRDGLRFITSIKGRTNDLVKHADGSESSAAELYKIFHGSEGVAQFRYVQDAIDEISILLVKDPVNKNVTKEDIENYVSEKIEKLYGYPEFKLNFKWMDMIPPDANGKMRCFVCNVKEGE
ncbi:MAG: phenylacetate--CoA ligase family protein [Firmicutes bacterium]|nr:phenylacetate--CoA ligase family protein [Bacillota bacterium]